MTVTKPDGGRGTAAPGGHQAVIARLGMLDRFLPVWIGAAMAAGLLLGRLVPGLNSALNQVAVHGTSLPIALGCHYYPAEQKATDDGAVRRWRA